jgi:hypothetical protein
MNADYMPESAESTVKMVKDAGGEASGIAADVSVTKQVEMMITKTVETTGGWMALSTTPASKAKWPILLPIRKTSSIASSRSTSSAFGSA